MEVNFGPKKYLRTKYSNLMGKTIVSYTEDAQPPKCSAECRGDGMTIKIEREICTMNEAESFLAEIRDLLVEAWKERNLLKPKLAKSLSGH